MGVLQMADSDRSGNIKSKDQEKSRKPSTESSQSPKAAQPSCLRGAFIRIFPKRAEPNNRTEEDPSSNQNTEDQEGVKGKKRRVTGSIFRLPCLRPADTTGNDIQNKTEEQSNDIVQEEELKPYSKASFLRKIRCYRLMREKDATEKEKVTEMAQRKHDRENSEVKQYKERVIEQSEEGLHSITQDEVVGKKGKDTSGQECHAKPLGEVVNDFKEQDFNVEHAGEQEESLRKQECCTGKLSGPGKESERIQDPALGSGQVGKDLTEEESCVGTLKEKNVLLEGEVSLQGDKNLTEKESEIREAEKMENMLDGVREQMEDVLESKVGDIDNVVSQPEEVGCQEKHTSYQQEEAMEKDLLKQDSHVDIVITKTEESVGEMQTCSPQNKYHESGDAGNYLLEQEDHTNKVRNAENNLSGKQRLEEDIEGTRNCLLEQDGQRVVKVLEDNEGDVADKLESDESHGEKEDYGEIGGDQENNLVDQDSPVENTTKDISQDSQCSVKDTQAETLGKLEDNTTKVSGVSSGEQNVTNTMSNQGLTMTISNQESLTSETCQLQHSSAKRTLGSENNEELLASVGKKTTSNNIIICTSSEEAHTQVLELQKEVLTSTNAMDLIYQEDSHILTCVNTEGDDMGCESKDLDSLREEVKDMVEWLVKEASDRLSHYTQEPEGTG